MTRSIGFAAGLAAFLLPALAAASSTPRTFQTSLASAPWTIGPGSGATTLMARFVKAGSQPSVSVFPSDTEVTCYGGADLTIPSTYTGQYPPIEFWGGEDCNFPVATISSSETLQRSYSESGPWTPSASFTWACTDQEQCEDPTQIDTTTQPDWWRNEMTNVTNCGVECTPPSETQTAYSSEIQIQ